MQNQNNNDMLDFTALIQELGIDKMPQGEQEKVLSDIMETVNFRVLTRVSGSLPEEQRSQLKARIAENPQQTQKIILDTISKDEQLKLFQEEIAAVTNELKGADPS
jgi:hypothetical protein